MRVARVPVPLGLVAARNRDVETAGASVGAVLAVVLIGSPATFLCSFVEERSERQDTDDTEGDREDDEQAKPWPAVSEHGFSGAERCFQRPSCTYQYWRHYRQLEEGKQSFPSLDTCSETAIQSTYEGQSTGSGQDAGDQQHHATQANLSVVEQHRGSEEDGLEDEQLGCERRRLAEKDPTGVDA